MRRVSASIRCSQGTLILGVNDGTLDIRGVAVDSNTSYSTLYIASDCGGLNVTTNKGTSWRKVNFGLPYGCVTTVAIRGMNIFSGTDQDARGDGAYSLGVIRSLNDGMTWGYANNGFEDTISSRRIRGFCPQPAS